MSDHGHPECLLFEQGMDVIKVIPLWSNHIRPPSESIRPVLELDIGQRLIPRKPTSLTMNVAMVYNFQPPNFDELEYLGVMKIDYVWMY
ncbi:hypothetical protein ACQY0O_004904 [Thecaphora frezii]